MVELDALTRARWLTPAQAAALINEHPETFARKVRQNKRPKPDYDFGRSHRYWLPETLLSAGRVKK